MYPLYFVLVWSPPVGETVKVIGSAFIYPLGTETCTKVYVPASSLNSLIFPSDTQLNPSTGGPDGSVPFTILKLAPFNSVLVLDSVLLNLINILGFSDAKTKWDPKFIKINVRITIHEIIFLNFDLIIITSFLI